MIIKSIQINNYKSIGMEQNKLILSETLTPLIGKNGSGKSNIINALSEIDLKNKMNKAFIDINLNRINYQEDPISYLIILAPTYNEKQNFKIEDNTTIFINKDEYKIEGSLLNYFDSTIKNKLNQFLEDLDKNPFNIPDKQLVAYKEKIKKIDNFDLFKIQNLLQYIEKSFSKYPIFTEYTANFKKIQKSVLNIFSMLPDFVFINKEKKLNSEYNLQAIKDELTIPKSSNDSLLKNLLQLITYDETKFIDLVTTYGSAISMGKKKKINNKIDDCINKPFSKFYKNENIKLELEVIRGKINFMISGNDEILIPLSEKSAGLQWYLNTFIYLKSNNLPMKNVIFLLDEPGVSLHINAQENLLNYFHHLTQNNQIVYATHSPYMISNSKINIGDIRLIVKNNGYTHIYNSPQSYKMVGNRSDTLAPIIECIGMNLNDTIGPSLNKINLITEGISDYYYINALANVLELDLNKYNIIPSSGATNVKNLCSIFLGWGCKFLAIFDYDREGIIKGGKFLEKNLSLEYNKNYIYLKDAKENEIENSDYLENPIDIEKLITQPEIALFKKNNNISGDMKKAIFSKLYFDNITKRNDTYTERCKENFKELFARIKKITFE
ncbi:MAG: AAA family ATPase [Sphaerochaetaceae bacterium]|nr:AAA family ATPase [Sphaerochaetaceae bacterium]